MLDRPGYDTLTGLPNRALFLSKIEEALTKCELVAVPVLHINNYPELYSKCEDNVNPLIGALAGRVQRVLHPADYLAKIQHHAFAVLMREFADLIEVNHRCDEILSALSCRFQIDSKALTVFVSIGVAIATTPIKGEELLLRAASVATTLQRQGYHGYEYCAFPPGTQIGRFEVNSFHSRDHYAQTYHARDSLRSTEVFLHLLTQGAGDLRKPAETLKQEMLLPPHPNVLECVDTGSFYGFPYIVFEKLLGITLQEKLAQKRLSFDVTTMYALQILEGLSALHQHRIVHGALKPENIFITADDVVKLLGIKTFFPSLPDLNFEGRIARSIHYLSPEQVLGTHTDLTTDIFSFGTVLYEMLCGRQAFRGNEVDVLNGIIKEHPPLLYSPQIPSIITPVLSKCLRKAPAERFANAGELALALRCALGTGT